MPGTVRSRIFGRLVCCLCLWIFCGYIYEVYRRACGYSMVTYTKFTNMPVDILWLHIRSLQKCLWVFCGYIYEVYRNACGYSVVTYTKFTEMPVDIM